MLLYIIYMYMFVSRKSSRIKRKPSKNSQFLLFSRLFDSEIKKRFNVIFVILVAVPLYYSSISSAFVNSGCLNNTLPFIKYLWNGAAVFVAQL